MTAFVTNFNGVPIYTFNQTGQVTDLDGGSGIAFNVGDWSLSNPNSGSQTTWGLRLTIGDPSTPNFKIRSVFIDNRNNIYPVYAYFPDSGQIVLCDAFDTITARVFTSSNYGVLYIELPYSGGFSPFTTCGTFVLFTDTELTNYNRAVPVYKRGSINMFRISGGGLINNDPVQEVIADNFNSGAVVGSAVASTTILGQQANIIRRYCYLCAWRLTARSSVIANFAFQLALADVATGLITDVIDTQNVTLAANSTVLVSSVNGVNIKFDNLNSILRMDVTVAGAAGTLVSWGVYYGHQPY